MVIDYGAARLPGAAPLGGSLRDKFALISNRRCCRLEFAVTACKQKTTCDFSRRKSAIHFLAQNSLQLSLENVFLIDRAYRLEIDLSPHEINANAVSNRRWIEHF
jgi:hypothetical protein